MHALGGGYQFIIEKVLEHSAARLPTDLLNLTRFEFSVGIPIGFLFVIIVAAIRAPIRVSLRVKRPIRNVQSFGGIRQSSPLQSRWSKPSAAIPTANNISRLGFAD